MLMVLHIISIQHVRGRNSLSLVQELLERIILTRYFNSRMRYDVNEHGEKAGSISRMANGIGQKVCRPDHSCTILHQL